jgi:hypothetical protein
LFSYGQEHQVHTGKFVQNCLQHHAESEAHHDQYVVQTHQERGLRVLVQDVIQSQKGLLKTILLQTISLCKLFGFSDTFQQQLSLSNCVGKADHRLLIQ